MNSGRDGGDEAARSPLLEGKEAAGGWLNKVIDVAEAKAQMAFALPMILTNAAYYFIPLVSVMFAGHLGELELAGSNLANSWAAVTGFSLMVGLSGSLETLCGQGFGAKMYRMMGVYLQTSCILSIIFTVAISVLWWYSDFVLTLLHQEPQIANSAGLYLKYLIPGLFAYGLLQNMLRFLQTQSVVMPLVVCSVVPLVLHIGITYALVHWSSLGYRGAPFAASISLWISAFMLGSYLLRAKEFERTWDGFTLESLSHVFTNLKLALPSAAMVCLEYWAFEILVLLAGLMPNSEITTSLIAMCVNTEAIAYMIAYGLSAAASTRVSNELGAGNPDRARHATGVTLRLTVALSLVVVLALCFGHKLWASAFSNSTVIINAFASMTPFLVVSIVCDFVQGILSGVARGCGWQHLVVFINLGTFYLIGMVVAAILGFKTELHAKGLWMGLICGLAAQTMGLFVLSKLTNWKRIELSQEDSCAKTNINVQPKLQYLDLITLTGADDLVGFEVILTKNDLNLAKTPWIL
ncbi:MATE efflux family protein [Perilla frutescens var. hirtella]|nr:MATE efflux family protein [Perilla frutescens var. frutescens]KAH6775618.1 MATE efflux family protein [Perilla frutescens var. hirtella]